MKKKRSKLDQKGVFILLDLTVVIITKNEEYNLNKCLKSCHALCKRIVVVDSQSKDNTVKVAESYGASVYQRDFDSHAAQKNWGMQNTNIDTGWILSLDADEELTSELALEIEKKLSSIDAKVNGVELNRRNYFMGKWIKHGGKYPEIHLRLVRTGKAMFENRIMDEHMILLEGDRIRFDNDFIDNNNKPLEWWISKHNWYSDRELLEYNETKTEINQFKKINAKKMSVQAKVKRLIKSFGYYKLPKFARAHLYFFYRYYIRLGFLDGIEGRVYHFLQAYWYRFLVDAKILEFENTIKKDGKKG